jgi:hypothetical protein
MKKVIVDGAAIVDEPSFHKVFSEAFGFPGFYGNNLNAWIDCMSYLDDPQSGMSTVRIESGDTLTIVVENATQFKTNCPDLWLAFLECVAFVNWRRIEQGDEAILAVSAYA